MRRFGPLSIPAKGGGGREQNILQDTGLLDEETQRGQEHAAKAEAGRRRVCLRSASPERMVRLGLSNLSSRTMFSHIRHTMHEVATLK